jgi:hypothetical protein
MDHYGILVGALVLGRSALSCSSDDRRCQRQRQRQERRKKKNLDGDMKRASKGSVGQNLPREGGST